MKAIKSLHCQEYDVRNKQKIKEIITESNIEASNASLDDIKELESRMLAEFRNKDQIIVGLKRKVLISRKPKRNKINRMFAKVFG